MAQIHYKELGLVNTREMLHQAMVGRYAVPAYNFNNLEQLEAIIVGCIQSKSPVILQCSGSARKYTWGQPGTSLSRWSGTRTSRSLCAPGKPEIFQQMGNIRREQ
jgi:fructose/tagatose bisphosphate aldolase